MLDTFSSPNMWPMISSNTNTGGACCMSLPIRNETWRPHRHCESLLGGCWKFGVAKKVSGAEEASEPCALGGGDHRATCAGGGRRRIPLRFAQADAVPLEHCRKKHRRIAVRESERR